VTEPAYRLVRPERHLTPAPALDERQRQVVEHRAGPLLVLAGPGTGKTTTLVESAVARVDDGVPIEQILMLTFSRRAAAELRDRVTARLGGTVREPVARTLHSYAFGVLRMGNVARGLPAPRLLSGAEQDVVVRELLEGDAGRWPAELRPALRTHAFPGELRDLLMRAVERGLDGAALAELGRRRRREDWVAAGDFLTEYHQVYAAIDPGAYDPVELIRAAVNTLRDDGALLSAERTRRRRIFVDEYQDTDPVQAELLSLLAEGADELVLVGDPDQSIYGFRGADSAAIYEVDHRFGAGRPVPVVALTVSRRAGDVLLAASRRVADRLPGRVEQRRVVAAGDAREPGRVEAALFRTASEEAAYIAAVLRREHLAGRPWARMAVLVRSTSLVLGGLRRALITAGVPVAVRSEDLPLREQPAVAVLLDVVRHCLSPASLDEAAAEQLLTGPIGAADIVYLRRLRRVLGGLVGPDELVLLAPAVQDEPGAAVLPAAVRRPVQRVAAVLAAGRAEMAAQASPEQVLWAIWEATGLARRWRDATQGAGPAAAAADRDLDAVVALFDAAARFTDRLPRAGVDRFAAHLAAQQIPGDALASATVEPDAVTVLTAHASKGLEWDVVCVAHVQEGAWPDLRRRGTLLGSELLVDIAAGRPPAVGEITAQLAEERRLFYVAATRARERLVVTAVTGDDEQPSRFLDEIDPLDSVDAERALTAPAPAVHLAGLVAELRAVVCDPAAARELHEAAAGELARLAASGVRGADPEHWWGLAPVSTDAPVADPNRLVPVSPSRIDAFLRCELRALLQDLGAREGDGLSASLGTLVHEVAAAAPPGATLDELEQALDARWASLDFGVHWFARNERERASGILARLVAWLAGSRAELDLVGIEQAFTVEVGDAQLGGRVDRLERDAAGRLVVVDLKTGKRSVRADELEIHPQLSAYQLAVESGAFGAGESSGGARLVQLAAARRGGPEQRQAPLVDPAELARARAEVAGVATRLRGSEFTATINSYCGNCDLISCCPLTSAGRPVTS
jgi:superfamily I DNA/RNA helicase/RecB family exonuclease